MKPFGTMRGRLPRLWGEEGVLAKRPKMGKDPEGGGLGSFPRIWMVVTQMSLPLRKPFPLGPPTVCILMTCEPFCNKIH